MTRMRFVLNDESKADVAGIEDLPSAKGSFTQSGQFQVIIGNDVKAFYEDFVAVSGIEGVTKDAAKQNQNPIQRAMTVIAEVFAPIIPAIIVGGLILGFRNCIDSVYVFGDGTQTLVQTSQFWTGLDSFLWLIGEAVFHAGIPVGICWSVTKKMGGTPMLGIVLGLTLISGQLLNAYSVSSTPTSQIPQWDFGFAKVNMIGYQAQVIPAILAAVTLGLLERFFRKISFPFVCGMVGSCIAGELGDVRRVHGRRRRRPLRLDRRRRKEEGHRGRGPRRRRGHRGRARLRGQVARTARGTYFAELIARPRPAGGPYPGGKP